MRYVDFESKLDLKLKLQRQLHTAPPVEHSSLGRAVEALDNELQGDPEYSTNISQYANKHRRMIG